jgi:hypothetical protein
MSSASIYDWEKSLQGNPASSVIAASVPKKDKSKSKKNAKGTIDYFMEPDSSFKTPSKAPLDDLNEIGDLIFRKIVEKWKMKNLE